MKAKKIDKQFLVMAFISIIIIIGFFTLPTESPIGRATSEKKITTWHCGFYPAPPYDTKGSWRWVSWPDTETRLGKTIHAKDANCVTGKWVCPYETCGDGKVVEDCYCIE